MIVQISLSYHICNEMSHTGTSQVELHANTEDDSHWNAWNTRVRNLILRLALTFINFSIFWSPMRVKKCRDTVKDMRHYGHRTWKIWTGSEMKDSSLRANFHSTWKNMQAAKEGSSQLFYIQLWCLWFTAMITVGKVIPKAVIVSLSPW